MPTYRISGIWKNINGVITHYCLHKVNTDSIDRGIKVTKADAVAIVENPNNSTTTWIWNYSTHRWNLGTTVHVVQSPNGKYLRTTHDSTLKDNLDHLLDYDWLSFG